jgi:hypothetical protein
MWYKVCVFEHFGACSKMVKNEHKHTFGVETTQKTRQAAADTFINIPEGLCKNKSSHVKGLRTI